MTASRPLRFAALVASVAALSACAPIDEEDDIVDLTGGGRTCPAEQYQTLVGQPRSEIDEAALPQPARVFGPGDAVTMDYRTDRLNVEIGEDGVVRRVYCG